MAIDELFKGLDRFTQGIQSLQQSRTLRQANELVDQIRNSEADDYAKQQQLKDLGLQVTGALLSQGASPQGIQTLVSQMQPTDTGRSSINTIDEALLSTDPKVRAQGIQAFQIKDALAQPGEERRDARVTNRLMQGIDTRDYKNQQKELRTTFSNYQKDYQKNIKDLREAGRYAKTALEILNSDGDASKMTGAIGFLIARGSGSNSQLSDAEREALRGRRDFLTRAKDAITQGTFSEFAKENKAALKDLAQVYVNMNDKIAKEVAGSITRNYYEYSQKYDVDSPFKYQDINKLQRDLTGGAFNQYTGPSLDDSQSSSQEPVNNSTNPGPANIPGVTRRK